MKDNLFQTLRPTIRKNPKLRKPQLEAYDALAALDQGPDGPHARSVSFSRSAVASPVASR